jgi:hypothetical protein
MSLLSQVIAQVGTTIQFNESTSKTNTETATLVKRIRLWRASRDDDVKTDVDIIAKKNYKENALVSSPPMLWPSFENKTEMSPTLLCRGAEKQKKRC